MSNFIKMMHKITKERVADEKKHMDDLHEKLKEARVPHQVLDSFKKNDVQIIAEIKFASPSLGAFSKLNDPVDIAGQYLENGASAISVLTEPNYFKGSLMYLKKVREAFPNSKLLMKDFILDEHQLLQARIYGADMILLIAAFLTYPELEKLHAKAIALGLTPLVEVHTLNELKNAEAIGSKFIGVNNRNLDTLIVDLNTSLELSRHISPEITYISESGFKNGNDIKQLYQLGYQGFLIGSHLMANNNPGESLNNIIKEVNNAR